MDASPIWISMKTAAVTIVITSLLGLLAAFFVIRRKREVTKAVIDGIFTIPMVLPPMVVGFFLLYCFGAEGPIGRLFQDYLGVKIAFSWGATVLAAVVISFPLMYKSARAALEQVDVSLMEAARTFGMGEWSIFFKIMIPNALPGIVSGSVLAFARGLGEFGATAMLAGNIPGRTRTLPLAIYADVAAGDMEQAGMYAAVVVAVCFAVVLVSNFYVWRAEHRGE